jgi:ATP-dependent DNA helicase PIF1
VCSYNVQGEPTRELDVAIRDMVLRELALHLAHLNSNQGLAAFGLSTPAAQPASAVVADEIARYDTATQAAMRDEHVPQLNPEQRAVYDNVMAAVNCRAFFVDGLGGTGKTFLYSCLLSTVCAQGQVAIAMASSGIAALLLDGGRTAHSRFKIPLQGLNNTSTCYISRDFELAALLQAATLIVWDEAVMMHRHVFEAVNRSLQDIMAVINPTFKFLPFGSLVVVFGGDFRQILHVVPRGTRGDVVATALNRSSIWQHVRVLKLHTNMRVQRLLAQGGAHAQADVTRQHAFADYLQRVGEGAERVYPYVGEDSILIPHDMCCNGPTVADLIEEVYGALSSIVEYAARSAYIIERAILTPLNEDVDALNKLINDKYAFIKHDGSPAQHRVYYSADSVVHGEQHGIYPTEFLNTLSFSGVPPHELHLQEGCPIILLRNMTSGLANDTRLIVIQLMQHVIEAEVATGPAKGQRVFIPRLSITPSDTKRMPFTMCRRQFPVRPAFTMTINKAQGQTLKMVGIFLPKPVFTHGQLYVAMLRIGCPEGVKLLVTNGWEDAHEDAPADVYTRNVVYTEVL